MEFSEAQLHCSNLLLFLHHFFTFAVEDLNIIKEYQSNLGLVNFPRPKPEANSHYSSNPPCKNKKDPAIPICRIHNLLKYAV